MQVNFEGGKRSESQDGTSFPKRLFVKSGLETQGHRAPVLVKIVSIRATKLMPRFRLSAKVEPMPNRWRLKCLEASQFKPWQPLLERAAE